MACPLCRERKAKRACPALGEQICPVCCGTKRVVEIRCPADCTYLTAAQSHPPAVVQRQQQSDRAVLLPLLEGLSERQTRLFLTLGALTTHHQAEALHRLRDDDIAQAAGALAATLETATRGIVYEHQPASLPAARLMAEMKSMVDEVAKTAGSAVERDAAIALRRLEHAAGITLRVNPEGTELQQLLARVLAPRPTDRQDHQIETSAPSLIIP